ncbi:hypothetical protein AG1IA_04982 [Rhizoctonia solani AG-1 IA]|uniref:Uncharacterized protein n=1 Tax=Thanatephorus cucumeris (strain AG1-IA) TaxID=983506 RepID=L8WW20_THACA|nr:hypothetical protein AG1IA_04982 [Rhizoctonia solani AG-1 IA]
MLHPAQVDEFHALEMTRSVRLTNGGGERNNRTLRSLTSSSAFINAHNMPPSGQVRVCAFGVSSRRPLPSGE